MGGGGGGGGGGAFQDPSYYANIERQKLVNEAQERRNTENQRQAGITGATNAVNSSFDSMFTPDFFSKRQNDYIGYYKPQIDDQFADAKEDLTYWLADKGLLDSSVRGDKTADLQKLYDTGLRQINTGALDSANKTKAAVAAARASLIDDARENADPGYAGTAASSRVSALSAPETYSPLADMFGTFTSALGQQAALEKAAAVSGGAFKPAFNTGLFAPSSSAVQVLNG